VGLYKKVETATRIYPPNVDCQKKINISDIKFLLLSPVQLCSTVIYVATASVCVNV